MGGKRGRGGREGGERKEERGYSERKRAARTCIRKRGADSRQWWVRVEGVWRLL